MSRSSILCGWVPRPAIIYMFFSPLLVQFIIRSLIPRVRVGIGAKPPKMDLADFVLSHFQGEEKKAMEDGYKEAADAV